MGGAFTKLLKVKDPEVVEFKTNQLRPGHVVEFEIYWVQILANLIECKIPLAIADDIIKLFLLDYVPHFLTISHNSDNQICFSFNNARSTLFANSQSFIFSAVLASHVANGRLDETRFALKVHTDPFYLTTSIECVDHRGPGHIPCETVLVQAIFLRDNLLVAMLGKYVIERCGKDEYVRQIKRARQVEVEENQKKKEIDTNDIIAENRFWTILNKLDLFNFEQSEELKTELNQFETQLKKPGSEKIIISLLATFKRRYVHGAFHDFLAKNILGLALKMRLPACDLHNVLLESAYQQRGYISKDTPLYASNVSDQCFAYRFNVNVLSELEFANSTTIIRCAYLVEDLYRKKISHMPQDYLDVVKDMAVPESPANRR